MFRGSAPDGAVFQPDFVYERRGGTVAISFISTMSRRRQASTPRTDSARPVTYKNRSRGWRGTLLRRCVKFAVSIPTLCSSVLSVEHAQRSALNAAIINHTHAYRVTSVVAPEVRSLSIRCPEGNSPPCLRQGASQTSACHRRCSATAASFQLASRTGCRSLACL